MRRTRHVLQTHALDFRLAHGAIALAALLNAVLINKTTFVPWWLASAFEIALLVPLSIATARAQVRVRNATSEHHWKLIDSRRRTIRKMALVLTAIVTAINFAALYTVMHGLLHGEKGTTGESLLLDALNIWFTNVVIFALWFWNLDRGGPAMRDLAKTKNTDFLFPQMAGASGSDTWTSGFVDYFYLSFTNATAFSPTDTMPLSPRSKLLMLVESMVPLLTVSLVAARAVNILA